MLLTRITSLLYLHPAPTAPPQPPTTPPVHIVSAQVEECFSLIWNAVTSAALCLVVVATFITQVCHAVVATVVFFLMAVLWGPWDLNCCLGFVFFLIYNFGWGHCRVLSSVPISSLSAKRTDSRFAWTVPITFFFPSSSVNSTSGAFGTSAAFLHRF